MNKQKSTRETTRGNKRDNAASIENALINAASISIEENDASFYIDIEPAKSSKMRTSVTTMEPKKSKEIGTTVWISKDVLERFRSFVLSKYGQLRGHLKEEVEKALLHWVEVAGSNSSKKINAAFIEPARLDSRTRRVIDRLALKVKLEGIVERPAWAWKRIVEEALAEVLGRKPDPRTVRRYLDILRRCCVEERGGGIVWRWRGVEET